MTRRSFQLALAFLLLATPVFAQKDAPRRGDGPAGKLQLTTEQKQSIRVIRDESRKSGVDLRARIEKLRIDIGAMVDDESTDRSALEQKLRQVADLQVQQKLLLYDTEQKILPLLNEEQKETWKEMKRHRMEGKKDRARNR